MDHGDSSSVSGGDNDVQYWKNLAEKYKEEKDEIQRELDDYVEDSRQLEKELEASLMQAEKKNKELEMLVNKTQSELDSMRNKLEQNIKELNKVTTDMQTLTNEKVQMQQYIRELEQKNDDLERAERVVAESVAAVEASLNNAIERNAILESEVDEKETLKVKLQRLVDETRDLKQELQVKEKLPDNERNCPIVNNVNGLSAIDSNRLLVEMETQTSPLKRDYLSTTDYSACGEAGTKPARIMALNLVNEILRKIGKLESKIAAHRANERNILNHADLNRTHRRVSRGTSSTSSRQLSSLQN